MNNVTILIPTYNRGNLIEDTIESCFNQTYKDFCILIYDDGSTDNTHHIIDSISKKYGSIKYIRGDKNNGIGYARQELMNNFKTEYGIWLDSDDLMDAKRIEKCVNYMDSHKDVDIVYSNIRKFSEDGPIDDIKINIDLYSKNNFDSLKNNTCCATAFFRYKIKEFKFETSMRHSAEDVLWLWKLICNDVKVGHISESLYLYRWHENRTGVQKRSLPKEIYQKEQRILHEKIKEYRDNV